MTRRSRFWLLLVGTALLVLSLVYVGATIVRNWSFVESARVSNGAWLLACIAAYGVSHLSTGLSWPLAIRQLGIDISLRDGLKIGLVAQIGKYLPGNVAHYAGRGALATQIGISLKSSGISTAIELGSAISAVILVAGIGLLFDPRPLAWLPRVSLSGIAILAAVLIGLVGTWLWLFRRGARGALLAGPVLCLSASFLLSSLSLYALTQALGFPGLTVPVALGAFTLAWGAGFVVPGAPAGLGVREAVLLTMLSPTLGTGPAVVITLLHRLITAIVDAVAATIGYAWLTSAALAKK